MQPSRCGLLFVFPLFAACGLLDRPLPITAAERAGLVVTAESISHPGLGFSAPNPQGAYQASPALQHTLDSAFAANTETAAWALNSADRGNVIVEATRFSRMNETNFRAYVRGFRRVAVQQADAVLEDSVTWTTRGTYVLAVRVRAAFLKSRCLSRSGTENLIVCLQVASTDSTRLNEVPAGFTLKE